MPKYMPSHNTPINQANLAHLKNRCASVLNNCHIVNTFSSLAKVTRQCTMALVMGIMAVGFGGTISSHAADYEEEAENSSNFIDIINAKDAYDQGYTGVGVIVGVIDEMVNVSHPEILGRATATIAILDDGTIFIPNWADNTHGSHVAGIIAASRDGEGMYGVAYGATIKGITFLGTDDEGEVYNFNVTADDLYYTYARIFNNSWGSYIYFYDVSDGSDEAVSYVLDLVYEVDMLDMIANYALDNTDTVFVFAAGNDGQTTASIEGLLPRYVGSELNNWISVGSLNSDYISIDGDELYFEDGAISYFSDLAAGAERWTVFAPGSYIYSLDASTGGYVTYSGTSMAAPVVSGALALVLQKFPWMTGSQLASTILSTANDNITIRDGYFFLFTTNYDEDAEDFTSSLTLYYDASKIDFDTMSDADKKAKIIALITASIEANPTDWARMDLTVDNVEAYYDENDWTNALLDYTSLESLESIWGQGVLDVGAAMGGIAELDANRMTAEYVREIDELDGESHAIEVLNTKGYNAVFSNDISGFAWDDIYHHEDYQYNDGVETDYNSAALALYPVGDRIGIEKTGDGTLILTGYNTYAGATLVTGGILGLMQTTETRDDDLTSGTLTDSSVVVRDGGTFVGDGYVMGSLFNYGIVAPGDSLLSWYSSEASSTLTVGTYTQDDAGALHIYFNSNAEHDTLSTTEASIDGALVLVPEADFYLDSSTFTLSKVITGDTIEGSFDSTTVASISPTLTLYVKDAGDYSYEITTSRADSAYSQYAVDAEASSLATALGNIVKVENLSLDDQNLITALDFSNISGSEIQSALVVLSPDTYTDLLQTSFSQQANFNTMVLSEMLFTSNYQALGLSDVSTSLDTKIANGEEMGVAYLASNDNYLPPLPPLFQKPTWEFWASAVGSYSKQGSSSLAGSNWSSTSVGLMVGANKLVSDALRLGFHIIATKSDTNYGGVHSAGTDTSAFYVGMQGLYTFPKTKHSDSSLLDGVYISGLVRAGFEQNDMQRAVYINGYTGYYTSDWMDTSLSAMLAVGKDWHIDAYYMGPFIRLDASYMHRPDIIESGSSMRLHIEGDNYVSLPMSLGAHIGGNVETFRGQKVHLDLLLAWQSQLLDESYESTAHFADFAGYNFTTSSETRGKDNFTMQATMKFNASESISFQFNAGTTLYNADDYDINGGLSVMWSF